MVEKRATRGLPIPSVWQIIVIAAALVAAWLIWSKYGRYGAEPDEAVAGNPLESLHAMEAYLRREADPVPVLLPSLDSQDPRERQLAAFGLGQIGPAAGQALDKLRVLLADENAQVRAKAVVALTRISPDKKSVAVAIAPLLADSESAVRENAGIALFQIGSSAVKPLLAMLHSDQPSARLEVVRVLRNMYARNKWGSMRDDILEAVGEVFNDPDPSVRVEAVLAAAEWGIASPQQVRELLQDPTRVNIAFVGIGYLGDDAVQLLPDVLALLDDRTAVAALTPVNSTPEPLVSVLGALSSMKTGARPATKRLVEIGNMRRDYACVSIAKTLHAIGAEEEIIAGVLAPLLLDPDPNRICSWSAGQLMVELCPSEGRRQVSLLMPKLGSNETSVDKTVLFALYALGSQAQEAVPVVVPLLQNRDPWVAEFAGHMLGATGIGSGDVVANLAQVVGNRSKPIDQRLACANALENIGSPAQSVVPALIKILGETEPITPVAPLPGNRDYAERSARAAIIKALGRIGGEDERLIPVLRTQLSSRSREVRAAAADALGRVAGQSAEAFTDVIRRLRDDDAGVRAMAALAVGRLATSRTRAEQENAVVPLINSLADEYSYVCQAAAISLGKIGPAAKAALPALRELMTEQKTYGSGDRSQKPDWLYQLLEIGELDGIYVQQTAKTAIEQIERGPQNE